MWSEHCSYKSTKKHLKTMHTKAPWVICGPGENAGIIDIGDGQAVVFKMESHKEVFQKCGLFDRQFEGQRMGDGEFGLRCLLNGFNIISNPMAFIIDVKAPTGGLRQMGSWDALRPKSLFAPRPVPSVLYLIRKYHGNQETVYYLIKNIPQSYMPYKFKKNKIMRLTYGLIFPLFLPIAFVAVVRSWNLATDKIEKGQAIAQLN
jgi:hypothetical protein